MEKDLTFTREKKNMAQSTYLPLKKPSQTTQFAFQAYIHINNSN